MVDVACAAKADVRFDVDWQQDTAALGRNCRGALGAGKSEGTSAG